MTGFPVVVLVIVISTASCFGRLGFLGSWVKAGKLGWKDVRYEHVTDSMLISRVWPLLSGPLCLQLGPRHGPNTDILGRPGSRWECGSPTPPLFAASTTDTDAAAFAQVKQWLRSDSPSQRSSWGFSSDSRV